MEFQRQVGKLIENRVNVYDIKSKWYRDKKMDKESHKYGQKERKKEINMGRKIARET